MLERQNHPALRLEISVAQAARIFPAIKYSTWLARVPPPAPRSISLGTAFAFARDQLRAAETPSPARVRAARAAWERRRVDAATAAVATLEAALAEEWAALRCARVAAGAKAAELAALDRQAAACAADAAALRGRIQGGGR